MMAEMLHFSTNLTAEVAGLTAAGAPPTLADSAGAMGAWLAGRYGTSGAVFVNHSGLTDRSHISPEAMVAVLAAEAGRLPGMLRERVPRRADGGIALPEGARLVAKTGTLNFCSALAGYVEAGGRRRAFAIFAADPAARARLPDPSANDAPGARAWEGRARAQEAALVRRWALLAG
jgi:D-alanyl-D-alanine carboxypeptidase/D-alanyl-D-alanine-endopeptidase (penicillin-binding protein 4)